MLFPQLVYLASPRTEFAATLRKQGKSHFFKWDQVVKPEQRKSKFDK